jgi:hypothetical protein
MRSLTERAGMLEATLQPLFDGGLLRIGVAGLRSRNRGSLVFLPARSYPPAFPPGRNRLLLLPGEGLPARLAAPLPDGLPRAA